MNGFDGHPSRHAALREALVGLLRVFPEPLEVLRVTKALAADIGPLVEHDLSHESTVRRNIARRREF